MISCYLIAATYLFSETINQTTEETTWKYTEEAEGVVIEATTPKHTTRIECTKELEFLRMLISSPSSTLDIKKQDTRLTATEISPKSTTSETYPLNGKPWIQQLWFGLVPFVKKGDQEISFYIVNPASLKMVKLYAKKMGTETLKIKETEYLAQKILLSLPGFRGRFWKAHIWFDTKEFRFLKYVGNKGPGTETSTIISLGEIK
ncbi:MAG: hypothetical protein KBC64_00190 [Simkaniaceae bacterium]|nr:hypothetical protein [Simkaniaceae bacterium]